MHYLGKYFTREIEFVGTDQKLSGNLSFSETLSGGRTATEEAGVRSAELPAAFLDVGHDPLEDSADSLLIVIKDALEHFVEML